MGLIVFFHVSFFLDRLLQGAFRSVLCAQVQVVVRPWCKVTQGFPPV
jgi:hypothetical protein